MSLDLFISKLEAEFSELPAGSIRADKEFRDVIEWNSLNALLIVAFLKVEYNQDVQVDAIQQCNTFGDIYDRFVASVVSE